MRFEDGNKRWRAKRESALVFEIISGKTSVSEAGRAHYHARSEIEGCADVVEALADLVMLRGPSEFIRPDNGPELVALEVREWIEAVGAKTAYIEPFVGELIPRMNSCPLTHAGR